MSTSAESMPLAEILSALNALPPEQHREAVTALQNDAGPVVKAFRSKVFASGKAEGAKGDGETAKALEQAEARVQELEGALTEAQAKVPDAKALEERLTKTWQKKVEDATKRAAQVEGTLASERTRSFRRAFGAALRDLDVDPEYADEVLAARYADRYTVAPDTGAPAVRKPGEDTAYEAADADQAIKLLAADVRKLVPAKFVVSHAEGGAGITTGGGAAGGDLYAQIRQQAKQQSEARTTGGTTGAARLGLRTANT